MAFTQIYILKYFQISQIAAMVTNLTAATKFPNQCKFNLNFNTHSIKILNGLAKVGQMQCWPPCIAHKLTLSILTFCQN